MNEKYRIGVDGGGTKTKCVIINSTNEIVATYTSDSTNINSVGLEKGYTNLSECMTKSLKQLKPKKLIFITSIGLSMSSCDRPADKVRFKKWVEKILLSYPYDFSLENHKREVTIQIESDAVGSLCAGTMGIINGIVLISGTGTITYGYVKKKNKRFRCGGWGPLFNDKGSGFWIGQKVLNRCGQIHDGMIESKISTAEKENSEKFLSYILKKTKMTKAQELIPYIYEKREWSRVAEFARYAFDLYRQGNSIAKEILHECVLHLFKYVQCACEKMKKESSEKFTLVLSGNILTNDGSIVAELLKTWIGKELKDVIDKVVFPIVDAAVGAALMCKSFEEDP